MDEFTRQLVDQINTDTLKRGAELMNKYDRYFKERGADPTEAFKFISSRLPQARHSMDVDALDKEVFQKYGKEFFTPEQVRPVANVVGPIAGGLIGSLGGPAGARAGAAIGTVAAQVASGDNPIGGPRILGVPSNLLETGANAAFGNIMNTNPLTGAAAKTFTRTLVNRAGQEGMMYGSQKIADTLVNPEEHPLGNAATSIGAFILGNAGLKKAAQAGIADPKLAASILGSETGAVTLPDVSKGTGTLWDRIAGNRLTELGENISNRHIPMPAFLERQTGDTLKQFANTPFDILQQKEGPLQDIGYALEDTLRESQRVSSAMGMVADQIKDRPLVWLNDFRNVLKGGLNVNKAKPENREEMLRILQPAFSALTDSKAKLVSSPEQEKLIQQSVKKQMLKIFASDINDPHFKMAIRSTREDLSTPEGTERFLDSMISHPTTPVDTRQIALDLYNIRAKTVQEVGAAYQRAFQNVLVSRILENPEAVKPASEGAAEWMRDLKAGKVTTQLGDYVKAPSKYEDLQGMLVHKTVAEGLLDMDRATPAAQRFFNSYLMNPWKTMKVGLNLPARLRDPISQIIFNDIYGPNPLSPFRVDVYAKAAKMIREDAPEYRLYKYWAGVPGQLNDNDIMPLINTMKHDVGPLDNFLRMVYDRSGFRIPFTQKEVGWNPLGVMTQYASTIMKTMDTWTKMAKFVHNLEAGKMDERAAIIDALKANGDPLRMSRAVKLTKDYAMPFFGWQSHAMKTMARGIAHHPVRTGKYFVIPALMAQEAVNQLGFNEQDWDRFRSSLPEYAQESVLGMPTYIPLPMRDDKGRIQMFNLSWWLPGLQDMAEMQKSTGTVIGLVQNPVFTIGSAWASNKKFSGAPIWNEWDEPSTKFSKWLGFITEQLVPPMTPFAGNAWQKISDSMGEDPNAMTPMQAFGSQVGYKVTPFGEKEQEQKHQALLKNWHSEAMRQYKKELSKIPNDLQAQQELRDKYREILAGIQMKMKGGE